MRQSLDAEIGLADLAAKLGLFPVDGGDEGRRGTSAIGAARVNAERDASMLREALADASIGTFCDKVAETARECNIGSGGARVKVTKQLKRNRARQVAAGNTLSELIEQFGVIIQL